jgi:tetratricopeptide (TPR) repeat protein
MCACAFYTAQAQLLKTADSFYYAQNYSAAIKEYGKILETKKASELDKGNALLRKGVACYELNQSQQALEDYFASLRIFEKINNEERTSAACINIANAYNSQEDLSSAEKYFKKAYDLSVKLNDSPRIAKLLSNLAMVKFNEPGKREAIRLHLFAITNYSKVMDEDLLCRHCLNLANCYAEIKNDSAILYYTKAESLAQSLEDSMLLLRVYLNKGDAYKQQGHYAAALNYLNKSLALYADYGDSLDLSVIYRNFADTYDSLSQYDKAYQYSKKEIELSEQLFNIEKSKLSSELSEKYESGKKDEKIKSQETENKLKSRNLLLSLIGLGLVAVLAAISFVNYKRKQKANLALQRQNEYIEKLNKQLDESNQVKSKLFSVISHDIRGPVSSIYAYLQLHNEKNNSNEVFSRQTEQLLETLEDLLIWSKSQLHQFVPSEEAVFLQGVIHQITGLQQTAINEKQLLIKNEVPQNFVLHTDINMLTIILRNIITNAIKYAVPGTSVEINCSQQNALFISVSNQTDTDEAIINSTAPSVNSNTSGLGLTLIKEFAEKLGGTISYVVLNNTVTATLSLPIA